MLPIVCEEDAGEGFREELIRASVISGREEASSK
jgi:hypothetical protein